MKIAMIGHKRIPSREGGVEIVVEELATRMAAMGHQVDVYNRKGKNVADAKADLEVHKLNEYKGVKLINVPTSQRKSLNALLYSLNATIKAIFGHYDIIHYHAEGPCVMLVIPHLLGIRTIATIHGLDWQRAKWGGIATKYILLGEKIAAKYADEVIVLSKGVQKYFLDMYDRKVMYIPNGVNIPDNKPANLIIKKYGLTKDSYILFLARLVPEKGLHYLLKAFKEVNTDKKLVVAGGSSHSDEYVDKIKKMAVEDNRIILTDFVQGQVLQELFSNCFLYVLPSDVEGMPISLLEAMSYGCRCLVSDINENVEVVGENGFTFAKGDIIDLKEKIIKILHVNNCYYNSNINILRDKYNWDTIVRQVVNLYE